jgi:hypothetical protein
MLLVDGVNELGTLGAIATSDGQDRWALTACHVVGLPPVDGRRVFQPDDAATQNLIGRTVAAKSDPGLDVAAIRLDAGVPTIDEVLGVALIGPAGAAAVGMRVVKAGRKTGVTEGAVTRVTPTDVRIEPPAGFPLLYELSEAGDSGSIWVEKNSGIPVALHKEGNTTGAVFALAAPLQTALAKLGLRLI